MEELTAFLTPRDTESVWACCCPRPYRPCARAEADAACVAAMVLRFRPVAAEARAMRRGGGITLPIFQVQWALLAVRGDLWLPRAATREDEELLGGSCARPWSVRVTESPSHRNGAKKL